MIALCYSCRISKGRMFLTETLGLFGFLFIIFCLFININSREGRGLKINQERVITDDWVSLNLSNQVEGLELSPQSPSFLVENSHGLCYLQSSHSL